MLAIARVLQKTQINRFGTVRTRTLCAWAAGEVGELLAG